MVSRKKQLREWVWNQNTKHKRWQKCTESYWCPGIWGEWYTYYVNTTALTSSFLPPLHFVCCCRHFPFRYFILRYTTPTSVRWNNSRQYSVNISSAIYVVLYKMSYRWSRPLHWSYLLSPNRCRLNNCIHHQEHMNQWFHSRQAVGQ